MSLWFLKWMYHTNVINLIFQTIILLYFRNQSLNRYDLKFVGKKY